MVPALRLYSEHQLTHVVQAHRIITQIVLVGGRVFGRAVTEAWKHASATQQYAKQGGKLASDGAASSGLTLDEACKLSLIHISEPTRPY